MNKIITSPIQKDIVLSLNAGDMVLLEGIIYTARDAAHKMFMEILATGGQLPFDVRNQVIYYVGPCPAKPGFVIGPAG
ncbi:MAG: fumarate hydratase C-terminal domain-containing protein, partial [Clostridiales bacterium]|nr:fumarate hydratase C-terminal domain-containing protein [Clostridiales bacterium]